MYLLFDDDGILVIASLFPPHPEKLNSDKQILLDGAVDDGKLWIMGQPEQALHYKMYHYHRLKVYFNFPYGTIPPSSD